VTRCGALILFEMVRIGLNGLRAVLMTLSKSLLITVVIASGAYAWHHSHHAEVSDTDGDERDDRVGFVEIAPSADAPSNTVVILAPQNCTSAQAKRADLMVEQLRKMGIPVTRLDHYSVQNASLPQPMIWRTNAVLTGKVPIVVVNGMAKANPRVSEVAAEYQRSH